jgi:hypothetical protein
MASAISLDGIFAQIHLRSTPRQNTTDCTNIVLQMDNDCSPVSKHGYACDTVVYRPSCNATPFAILETPFHARRETPGSSRRRHLPMLFRGRGEPTRPSTVTPRRKDVQLDFHNALHHRQMIRAIWWKKSHPGSWRCSSLRLCNQVRLGSRSWKRR